VKTEQRDQENKPNTDQQTITLLVDPPAAERMALAMHEGKVHLTLRNPEDADTMKVASLDTRELLGNGPVPSAGPRHYSAPKEKIVYRDNPVAPAPPPAQPYKVTVIKKGKDQTTEPASDKK
jgi:hypothetical protein